MAHIVPNAGDTTGGNKYEALDQAEPDALDIETLALSTSGVVSGCAITSNNSASNVAVAEGIVVLAGVPYAVSANAALSIPSAPSDNRFDLVVARISGGSAVLTVLQGENSSTNPEYPKSTSVLNVASTSNNFDPDTDVLLAALYRSGSQAVTGSRIVDKRRSMSTHIVHQGTTAPDAGFGTGKGQLYYRTANTDGAQSGVYVKQADGSWVALAKDVGSHLPIGAMVLWPTAAPVPAGCIEANGQSLGTAAYAALFSIYGYEHGGSGANFNVPNYNDRFLRGTTSTVSPVSEGGSNSVTLTAAQLPSHTHSMTHTHTYSHSHGINHDHPSSTTGSEGAHTHGPSSPGNTGFVMMYYPSSSYYGTLQVATSTSSGRYVAAVNAFPDQFYPSSITGGGSSHSHSFNVPSYSGSTSSQSSTTTSAASSSTTGSTGSGSAIDTTPKFKHSRLIIRASLGNSSSITGSTNSVGRFSGDGPPTDAPEDVGSIYIDYTNDIAYVSVGTSTVADWDQIATI